MGSCTAGGAYVPAMSDETVIVKGTGTIFLGGPPLVKAATGEEVSAEDLGGAEVHSRISGVTDHFAVDDRHALAITRDIVAHLHRRRYYPWDVLPPEEPLLPGARTLRRDPARHAQALRCARDHRPPRGRLALPRVQGALRRRRWSAASPASWAIPWASWRTTASCSRRARSKPPTLSSFARQRRIPLVFLQNITGFMVGREYENKGIAKDGAKMVMAVANANVPKFTVIIGGCYGAGNYGMCGRAYGPRQLWMWPNARISVMGGREAANVLLTVRLDNLRAQGKDMTPEERDGVHGADPRQVRGRGQPLLQHRPPLGRRHHRPASTRAWCWRWASPRRATGRSRRRRSACSGCRGAHDEQNHSSTKQGGWKYYQLPRSEFYEELSAVLAEFSDFLLEDPEGARKLDQDPYNDWFYCGYGGDEEAFRVSLWPAYLPDLRGVSGGRDRRRRSSDASAGPRAGIEPVTVYLGEADDVIELAEDEKRSPAQLADSLADFAGIELVDDWEDAPAGLRPTRPRRTPPMSDLLLQREGRVARVTLNRPAVHNAFNAALIADLSSAFTELSADPAVRVVVLAGAGPSFCAGADVHWMQQSLAYTEEQNLADAQRLAPMLRTIDECAKPVVALVQGAALGGGAGLVAVADLVMAEETARFGLTEVKLGIVPAVISPFVLRKMAPGPARACSSQASASPRPAPTRLGLVTTLTSPGGLEAALAGMR